MKGTELLSLTDAIFNSHKQIQRLPDIPHHPLSQLQPIAWSFYLGVCSVVAVNAHAQWVLGVFVGTEGQHHRWIFAEIDEGIGENIQQRRCGIKETLVNAASVYVAREDTAIPCKNAQEFVDKNRLFPFSQLDIFVPLSSDMEQERLHFSFAQHGEPFKGAAVLPAGKIIIKGDA